MYVDVMAWVLNYLRERARMPVGRLLELVPSLLASWHLVYWALILQTAGIVSRLWEKSRATVFIRSRSAASGASHTTQIDRLVRLL